MHKFFQVRITEDVHIRLMVTAKRRKTTMRELVSEMIVHCLELKRFTKDVEVKE